MSNQTTPSKSENKTAAKANGRDSSHPVADQIANTLHASVDSLHESAANTETSLRLKQQASGKAFAEKRLAFEKSWNASNLKKYAIENPVKTAGIAFGIGMLASMLIRKK